MNNEFYYYDGKVFQRCLTIENDSKGLNLDKDYIDYVSFAYENDIATFLTFNKIEKNCLYNFDKLNSFISILTPNGWDMLTTENMDLRPKGLDTKDYVILTVHPVMVVKINESFSINKHLDFDVLEFRDSCIPVVRMVPKSNVLDYFRLDPLKVINSINSKNTTLVTFQDLKKYEIEDIFNLENINLSKLTFTDNVTVILN